MKKYLLIFFFLLNYIEAYDYIYVDKINSTQDVQESIDQTIVFNALVKDDKTKKYIKELDKKYKAKWKVVFGDYRHDTEDGDIYTPKEGEVSEDGLSFSLKVDKNNIYKYAHVSFIPNDEMSYYKTKTVKIQRNVKIQDIIIYYSGNSSLCNIGDRKTFYVIVQLLYNINNKLRVKERENIRWIIDDVYHPEYDGKEYFLYPDDKRHKYKVYFQGKEDEAVEI